MQSVFLCYQNKYMFKTILTSSQAALNITFWEVGLAYIDVLVWPIIFLIFLVSFKGNIERLIDRVKRVSGGGVEVDVEVRNKQLAQEKEGSSRSSVPTEELLKDFLEENKKIKRKYEKELKELKTTQKEEIKKLREMVNIQKLQLEFEQANNIMFNTQIELMLRLLLSKDKAGLEYSSVERFFAEFKDELPEDLSWGVDDFLSFLINKEFIKTEKSGNKLLITEKGESFLDYIELRGYLT